MWVLGVEIMSDIILGWVDGVCSVSLMDSEHVVKFIEL